MAISQLVTGGQTTWARLTSCCCFYTQKRVYEGTWNKLLSLPFACETCLHLASNEALYEGHLRPRRATVSKCRDLIRRMGNGLLLAGMPSLRSLQPVPAECVRGQRNSRAQLHARLMAASKGQQSYDLKTSLMSTVSVASQTAGDAQDAGFRLFSQKNEMCS